MLGVWAAPGGRETFQSVAVAGSRFWKVPRPPGAAQTPKVDDLRFVKKSYINYLSATLIMAPRGSPRSPGPAPHINFHKRPLST